MIKYSHLEKIEKLTNLNLDPSSNLPPKKSYKNSTSKTITPLTFWDQKLQFQKNLQKEKPTTPTPILPEDIENRFQLYKKTQQSQYTDIFFVNDVKYNTNFTIKKYFSSESYIREKMNIEQMIKYDEIYDFNDVFTLENLDKNALKKQPFFHIQSNDIHQIIFTTSPICTLQDIINSQSLKKDSQIQFTDQELISLFRELFKKIAFFKEKFLLFGAISPKNIGIFKNLQTDSYEIKFINYQNMVQDYYKEDQTNQEDTQQQHQQQQQQQDINSTNDSSSQDFYLQNSQNLFSQPQISPPKQTIDEEYQEKHQEQQQQYQQYQYPLSIEKQYSCKCIREGENSQLQNNLEQCFNAEIFSLARIIWKIITTTINNTPENFSFKQFSPEILDNYKPDYPYTIQILKLIFTPNDIFNFNSEDIEALLLTPSQKEKNPQSTFQNLIKKTLQNQNHSTKSLKTQEKIQLKEYVHFYKCFKLYENYATLLETQPIYPKSIYQKQEKISIFTKLKKKCSTNISSMLNYQSALLLNANFQQKNEQYTYISKIKKTFHLDSVIKDRDHFYYYKQCAKIALKSSKIEEYVKNLLKSLKKAIKFTKNQRQILKIIQKLGQIYPYTHPDFQEKIDFQKILTKPITILQENHLGLNSQYAIIAYQNIGNYWFYEGNLTVDNKNLQNALEAYQKALKIIKTDNFSEFKSNFTEIFLKILQIYNIQQNHTQFHQFIIENQFYIDYYLNFDKNKKNQYIQTLINTQILQKNYQEAQKLIKEQLKSIQNNPQNIYFFSLKLKEAFISQEKTPESPETLKILEKIYHNTVNLKNSKRYTLCLFQIYHFFSDIYLDKQKKDLFQPQTSLDYLEKSLDLAQNTEQKANTLYKIGQILRCYKLYEQEQENYDKSQGNLRKAEELYFEIYTDKSWKFEQVFDETTEILFLKKLYEPTLTKAKKSLKIKLKNHGHWNLKIVEQYLKIAQFYSQYLNIQDQENIIFSQKSYNQQNFSILKSNWQNNYQISKSNDNLLYNNRQRANSHINISSVLNSNHRLSQQQQSYNNNSEFYLKLNQDQQQMLKKYPQLEIVFKQLKEADKCLQLAWSILYQIDQESYSKTKYKHLRKIDQLKQSLFRTKESILQQMQPKNQQGQNQCIQDLLLKENNNNYNYNDILNLQPPVCISQNSSINRSRSRSVHTGSHFACCIF